MSNTNEALRAYLAVVEQALKTGQAGEHTHRPALEALLEALGGDGVDAINEPRQIACGAPDFIVVRGTVPLGHVEAKDVGVDLGKTERGEQLVRYRESLGNLVLTDYLSFRWYLDGELRLTADLPRPGANGKIRWNDDAASRVAQLLQQFLIADIPLKSTPQDLATRMAGLAKLIRGLIEQTFKAEDDAGELHGQLDAFRKVLIESLSVHQFADMYAQTLAYGLFAARCTAPAQGFTRQIAATALPKTNPFLRKLFNTIAGPDLDPRIAWAVDQLAELLARADMAAILADFGRRTRQEDPVVHFYETFLAAYDPKMREARGVYYTPEPVVGYIVRSVDALLKRDFGMKDGLAHAKKIKIKRPKAQGKGEETVETHRLQILDPATGTGTFLYAVIAQIRDSFDGNAGAWPGYVAEHLLPRLFGFELLMAPYAVAHMKLGLELEQSGYDFASDQRLGVFLTNSLEEAHELTGLPLFTQWLAEESRAAANVKRDAPVMVVLGNPPYSGHSANTGAWIAGLLRGHDSLNNKPTENYFEVDGRPLGERNPKWLNDDYVKFIRFAQWRIQQTGHGVLAFVTNHGYLENRTFRGMRESLMRGFDDIYIIDLHGNSKKSERSPDGGKDENVFDIQQGVSIGLFVKRDTPKEDEVRLARVSRADLYGSRAAKYEWLSTNCITSTDWQAVEPDSPNYYYFYEDPIRRAEYLEGWGINEAMPVSSLGIATARDFFCISENEQETWDRVSRLSEMSVEDSRQKFDLGKDSPDWNVQAAKDDVAKSGPDRSLLRAILYRPFDTRHTYYTGVSRGFHCRPRAEVMRQMTQGNIAFSVARDIEIGRGFEHIFVARELTTLHTTSIKEVNYHIPLWLHTDHGPDLLSPDGLTANFDESFLDLLTGNVGDRPTPEDAFAWIYSVLYTPSYRARYADFLRRDFPRIPLPPGRNVFEELVAVGRELIALHTMEQKQPRITRFDVAGTNEVVKVRWAPAPSPQPSPACGRGGTTIGRVYINDAQHFDGVPQGVWDTHIGGYRVAEKWLKDRKGRQLSFEDVMHYHEVIAALARTLELQAQLDEVVAAHGGWPLR